MEDIDKSVMELLVREQSPIGIWPLVGFVVVLIQIMQKHIELNIVLSGIESNKMLRFE